MNPITDYASLQSAAAGMIHRPSDTNITANLPLFIQLCEADLYRRLLLRDMEAEAQLASVIGNNYVALPSAYVSPIKLWLLLGTAPNQYRVELTSVLPEQLPYWPNSIMPRYWAIDGDNIRLDAPTDQVYTLPFRFIQSSALSNTATTNYLLTKAPDVYLFGTLKQVAIFTKDADDLQKYSALFEDSIKSLKAAEDRNRTIAPLRADPALVGQPRDVFNIYRGQ